MTLTFEERMARDEARHQKLMTVIDQVIQQTRETLDLAEQQIKTAYQRGYEDGYKAGKQGHP
jgi:hypothetical protein